MRKFHVSFLSALFVLCAALPASANVGQPFHLSHLQCKNAACTVGRGIQPGLSTVEVSGNLPSYAGYSVRFIIGRKSNGTVSLVEERTLGIFSDGHFTASIPAYNYADGSYIFALMPKQSNTVLASGVFVKGSGKQSTATRRMAPSGLTGEWIGIAGTYGRVRIYSNGTYLFNELRGRYRASGNTIVFSGPLSVWNGGRATIGNGTIEFYWTNAQGATQYFAFEKT